MDTGFKKWIKDVLYQNPLAKARRRRMRAELKNTDMTLFCPSCMGGELFHDLGLQFRSPTINLMMYQTDFVKFVTHFEEYTSSQFEFFKHPEYTFPCAKLKDITVFFTHYHTPEEALEKWCSRMKRIDWDNVFIYCSDRDGITKEEVLSLGKLNVRGIVFFSAHDYSDIPYALYIPKFKENGVVTGIQDIHYFDGHRSYEEYFDFVKWFNEANGGNYDVSPYSRIKKS